jgi:hypothetical protein
MPPSAKTAFQPPKPVDPDKVLRILKRKPATLETIAYTMNAKANSRGIHQTLIDLRGKGIVTFSIHSGKWTLVPQAA